MSPTRNALMPDRRPFFSWAVDPLRVVSTIALLAVAMGVATAIFWRGFLRTIPEPGRPTARWELEAAWEDERRLAEEWDRMNARVVQLTRR